MKQFGDRKYYDKLEELVDPSRAALLVVNMMNDQCHPNGHYAKKGIDISMHRAIIPKVKNLVEAARTAGVMVVFLQHSVALGFINDSPAVLRSKTGLGADPSKPYEYHNIEGSWGQKIIDELNAGGKDFFVKYNRTDPFVATNLEQLLRSHQRESTILCGNETQGVVWTTSAGVANRDFYRVLVQDCVASTKLEYHNFILNLIRDRVKDYDLVDSATLIDIWARMKK